jgi:hypothetical protein
MHVPIAMTAPLRLSGITPRVSTARPAPTAILMKIPINPICLPVAPFPPRKCATITVTDYPLKTCLRNVTMCLRKTGSHRHVVRSALMTHPGDGGAFRFPYLNL